MNEKETLKPFIGQQIKAGVAANIIRQQLSERGWHLDAIDEVIAEVLQESPPEVPFLTYQLNSISQEAQQTGQQGQYDQTVGQPGEDEQAAAPEKYGPIDATKEAVAAIKNNLAGISAMAAVELIILILAFVLTVAIILAALYAAAAMVILTPGGSFGVFPIIFMLAAFLFAALINGLLLALINNLFGLVLKDGADGKKSVLKQTLKTGIKRSPRVYVATLLYLLLSLGPLTVAFIVSIILVRVAPTTGLVSTLLIVIGLVSTVALSILFRILPMIALFEPETPITGLFARTKTLLANGGLKYAGKLLLLLLPIAVVYTVIMSSVEKTEEVSLSTSVLAAILPALVYLFNDSLSVVYYRNRQAVNAQQQTAETSTQS